MPRFTTKRYEQLLQQMLAKVVTRTVLSDVADTSVVKHVLAAAARQDDEQYYQMGLLLQLFSIDTATGDDLDERAKDIQPGTVYRREAQKSAGNLVFSRTGTSGTVTIPSGTKVKTAGGVPFATTAKGSITPTSPEQVTGHGIGRDSGLVPAQAVEPGSNGNVASSTIVKFMAKPAGVDEVVNLSPFAYGADKESDDSFRNRLKTFIGSLSRSTVDALESGVLGAQDEETGGTILFSKAVEDSINRGFVTVYIDDGTGSAESIDTVSGEIVTAGLAPGDVAVGGEEQLNLEEYPIKDTAGITIISSTRGVLTGGFKYDAGYDYWVNPSSGQINFSPALTAGEQITADYTFYTGLIALAQKIIDGDPNDRVTYPGLRAAGVLVYVRTPQVLVQTIEVTTTIEDGYDYNEVQTAVREAVKEYINALGISGDVLVATLYKRIMSVAGVYNVLVDTPASDTIMLDNQLARVTDPNITVN